ncbi:hypothetical protein NX059_004023 [Plenodomus lindquistii]|nr:hypothetical protein NX059_004023 [Plenodomus lindquistii]
MPILSRNGAPSLLRTVRGKMHASDKDHEEEPAHKKRRTDDGRMTKKVGTHLRAEPQSEDEQLQKPPQRKPKVAVSKPRTAVSTQKKDGFHADPVSSGDDELRKPPPRKEKPVIRTVLSKQEEDAIYADPMSSDDELRIPSPPKQSAPLAIPLPRSSPEDMGLRKPAARKSTRKDAGIRKPARESYAKGKAEKARQAGTGDKENSFSTAPASSPGSVTDAPYTWGMEHSSQKSSQNAKSYGSQRKTVNIHAAPQKKTFGKPRGAVRSGISKIQSWNKLPSTKDDDDVSDYSVKESDESDQGKNVDEFEDLELTRPKPRAPRQELYTMVKAHDSLMDGLALPPSRSKTGKTTSVGSSAPATQDDDEAPIVLALPRVHDQLEDWMKDQPEPSPQVDSSAPQEALDNLQDYIQQLPSHESEDTQCTLCKEPVEMEDYWSFWKGRSPTVKNHALFCHTHKKKAAQTEYTKQGYPPIDWDALPTRIRKHRTPLLQMLTNDRPSTYRTRYEPLALTGKAAAVPSRRKDLPSNIQDELDSYALDDTFTYPGYYGPHGRRAITEHVMRVLKNEIKNCKDAVVQGSGPAAFVQAVLVPECAVLLIMEDCKVDRERAEEIRENTVEMGGLVHEEVEDVVEGVEGSEDENEYLHR